MSIHFSKLSRKCNLKIRTSLNDDICIFFPDYIGNQRFFFLTSKAHFFPIKEGERRRCYDGTTAYAFLLTETAINIWPAQFFHQPHVTRTLMDGNPDSTIFFVFFSPFFFSKKVVQASAIRFPTSFPETRGSDVNFT